MTENNVIASMAMELTKKVLLVSASKYTQFIENLIIKLENSQKIDNEPPTVEAPKKSSAVKFVDVEDESEADEPKGTYAYDPVQHKVVFTPAQ